MPIGLKSEKNNLPDLETLHKIWRLLRKNIINIVHCHGLKAAFFGGIICRITGVSNLIYSAHSEVPFRESQKKEFLFYKAAEKAVSYYSKRIIAVSTGIENRMKVRGIPTKKITVIQNGIDVDKFKVSIDKNLKRKRWGFLMTLK